MLSLRLSNSLFYCPVFVVLTLILTACGGGGGGGGGGGAAGSTSIPSSKEQMLAQANSSENQLELGLTRGPQNKRCEITEQAPHGVVEAISNTNSCIFHYAPNTDYIGNDRFTVKLSIEQEPLGSNKYVDELVTLDIKVRILSMELNELANSGLVDFATFLTNNSYQTVGPEYGLGATGTGDFNGDGQDDFVVRSKSAHYSPLDIAVIYGAGDLQGSYDFRTMQDDFDNSLGFTFRWLGENSRFFSSVNFLGDYNSDGINDLLIGGPNIGTLIVFGGQATSNLQEEIETNGRTDIGLIQKDFRGDQGHHTSINTGVGDIDGDGFSDFLIAHYFGLPNYETRLSFVHGNRPPVSIPDNSEVLELYTLRMDKSDQIPSSFGTVQKGYGDVNGDGIDDIVTADHSYNAANIQVGKAYLLYGAIALPDETELNQSDLSLDSGIVITQDGGTGDNLGQCTSIVRDINGDGLDEVSVSSSDDNTSIYMLYGAVNLPSPFQVEAVDERYGADSTLGFSIRNGDVCDIISIGDINGDGFNDIVAIDSYSQYLTTGKAFFIYGAPEFPSVIDLEEQSDRYFRMEINAFLSISPAGDIDGDGYDDVLISTYDEEGSVYLLYGGEKYIGPVE